VIKIYRTHEVRGVDLYMEISVPDKVENGKVEVQTESE
jgi:hypothetical protein